MLVTAGDSSAADPVPVVIETPRGLAVAPCLTGRPIATEEAHRTVLPGPAPGPCGGAAPCGVARAAPLPAAAGHRLQLHLHGVSDEDIAAIVAWHEDGRPEARHGASQPQALGGKNGRYARPPGDAGPGGAGPEEDPAPGRLGF